MSEEEENGSRSKRLCEGQLVVLVQKFTALIIEQKDLDAKRIYDEAPPEGRIAIQNAVPGYVTLIKRRYGLS